MTIDSSDGQAGVASEIEVLRGLGPKSAAMLHRAGIESIAD
jgi:predicted flap endonuclease-1-like 5' DNA nuclease